MRNFYSLALIILAFFSLTLASCNGRMRPENLDLNRSFTFTAALEYNGRSSVAELVRTKPGEWNGTLVEPYALQGVEFVYAPPETSVSYGGFTISHDADAMSDLNITAFMILKSLENAFASEKSGFTYGKDWVEITGTLDGNIYVLKLDKDGFPLSLDIPNQQLKATFSGVSAVGFS
ncbi:MAG: hypothetical protein FWG70_04450 [Oscillospiraceae bacterium]|nr:hypothetical protein [Oscillospiraceae bacterium]